MNKEIIQPDRGILRAQLGRETYQLTRYEPSQDLIGFVRHYWIVRWDLRGKEPFKQEVLQYPCINLVFEQGKTRIYGVNAGRSVQILEGKGSVLGILFQPGGFYPFYGKPLYRLTDQFIECQEVFGEEAEVAERDILSAQSDHEMVSRAERMLRSRLPEVDKQVELVGRLVDGMIANREITKVEEAAEKFQLSRRTMQRLFKVYIGVSPKWVIQRSRIQEAALRAAEGEGQDWASLAADLGYFDQAHFIKDFKKLIGCSPDEYNKQQIKDSSPT